MIALRLSIAFFLRSWALGCLFLLATLPLQLDEEIRLAHMVREETLLVLMVSFLFSLPVLLPIFLSLLCCKPWHFPKSYQQAFLATMGLFISFGWMTFLHYLIHDILPDLLFLPFVASASMLGLFFHQSNLFKRYVVPPLKTPTQHD